MPPVYGARSGAERRADICVLGFGLALGVCASVVLITTALQMHRGPRSVVGLSLYTAGLLAMLAGSLAYRSALEPMRRQFLRRLDHAAIFMMIAGSTTPFALMQAGWPAIVISAAVWGVAGLGIASKLVFPIGGIRRSIGIYLVLGWASLVAVGPAISAATAMLIAAGGAFYSIGVVFLLSWRMPYRLAIWHAFVLAGAACHYAAIMTGVVFA